MSDSAAQQFPRYAPQWLRAAVSGGANPLLPPLRSIPTTFQPPLRGER